MGVICRQDELQTFFGEPVSRFVKCGGIRFDGAVATDWIGRHGDGEGPGEYDSIEASESGIKSCRHGSPCGFSDVEQLSLSGII